MRLSTLAALLVLSGCDASKDDTAALGEPGKLADVNNYAFTGALDVPSIVTASATNVSVCWDEVLHDLQCHAMDPTVDIENVGLVRFPNYSQEEVEVALSTNDLQQSAISGYVEYQPGSVGDGPSTCANLEDFSFFGTGIDVTEEYTEAGGTYMLLLTQGTTPGVGARMITFLEPRAAETITEVSIGDGCGLLAVDADLEAATRVPIPAAGPFTVDWSELTIDGQGNPIAVEDIDGLMIAFYAGETPASLETQLLDLELVATDLYTMPLTGATTADLAGATGASGAFTGFSGEGTWLLALRCSTCYNPAPIFLTVVEPT
ncbi:MAG: hypothetical protein Q8P41_22425 [Pseudomonadota bacterium]|nr:hypothetical protein [Pseudomonadota bacterium]